VGNPSGVETGPSRALRRQPDGGVGGAVAVVTAAPLDHLEEQLANRGGVEVHELSPGLAVVEETELMQLGDGRGGEVEPGDQVVVVVVRDSEELQPAVPSLSGEVVDDGLVPSRVSPPAVAGRDGSGSRARRGRG
jgi:hypothetical protein